MNLTNVKTLETEGMYMLVPWTKYGNDSYLWVQIGYGLTDF
jgi:hypothetical protein